jgi:hypothetical protein
MPDEDRKPVTQLKARDLEEFFAKVEELPEKPVGDGRCQLVKKSHGTRAIALCRGKCATGKCFTRIQAGPGDRIRVWCECM